MIGRFLKKLAKCCDFVDRVLIRFVGERLILAIVMFIIVWIQYAMHRLQTKEK
ncbi:MAG: hypothetical protein LBF42_01230 [Puniceicoccales bacterium]|jgi:hypothetical protein|nr:hypothetical protein [Puniceicoccales bacterium]